MSPRARNALINVGLFLLALQFFPVRKRNPLVTAEIKAPAPVLELLRRACYDCHSNETAWPWYSRIAPLSWLIAHDVNEGRRKLNFSDWKLRSKKKRRKKRRKIAREVSERRMPLWYYTPLHPEARLSDEERALLVRWARPRSR